MYIINWLRWLLASMAIKVIKIVIAIILLPLPTKKLGLMELEKMDMFVNLSPEELREKKKTNTKVINVTVHDNDLFRTVLRDPFMLIPEAYVDGRWECTELDELVARTARLGQYRKKICFSSRLLDQLHYTKNPQGIDESWETGRKHYDFGNDHFREIIGPTMVYSCGDWKKSKNLEEAQIQKLNLIARKLKLKPGMRVLDIGCGWGAMAKLLAEKYGAVVVGVTVSMEGAKFARNFCKGLSVEIRTQDFRTVDEKFDRIICMEMMEHIGPKNFRTFYQMVHRCLVDDGLFYQQVVVLDNSRGNNFSTWIQEYVIPNSYFPHQIQLMESITDHWHIEDLQNIGPYNDITNGWWRQNFIQTWSKMKHLYPPQEQDKIYRTWFLYFSLAMAGFRARALQMWQLVLSKDGMIERNYESVR